MENLIHQINFLKEVSFYFITGLVLLSCFIGLTRREWVIYQAQVETFQQANKEAIKWGFGSFQILLIISILLFLTYFNFI